MGPCDAAFVEIGDAFTAQDIGALNEQSVARASAILRIAGSALVVVGALGALGWFWFEVRIQQEITHTPLELNLTTGRGAGLDLVDRIDAFANSISLLMVSSLVVGLGLASRLLADYTVTRTGGTTTGFVAGDPLPDDEIADGPTSPMT